MVESPLHAPLQYGAKARRAFQRDMGADPGGQRTGHALYPRGIRKEGNGEIHPIKRRSDRSPEHAPKAEGWRNDPPRGRHEDFALARAEDHRGKGAGADGHDLAARHAPDGGDLCGESAEGARPHERRDHAKPLHRAGSRGAVPGRTAAAGVNRQTKTID